ncbi:radical SAM protein [Patescibacteria group bacterium]|nr:radical SAM protein [Patescibacteria group bacterium]MBU1499812.1 radical SAM protein [Patescibacteria group bacterium]
MVKEEPKINLSFDDAVSRLKKAHGQGAVLLSLDGGEPTILPYFKELIKKSIYLGFKSIAIKTNGLGFSNYQYAKNIIEGNQNIIKIYLSLHGADKSIHDKLAQKNNSFSTALKAIKNIVKFKCDFTSNIVICSLNFLYLKEYIDLLKKLEVKKTIFLFIASRGNALKNSFLIPEIETTVPFIKEAIDYANSKDINVALTFFPFCLLDNYYINYAVEFHIPGEIKNFDELSEERYKSKNCQKCRYYAKCPGVWKEYYQLRGFQFKPIIS